MTEFQMPGDVDEFKSALAKISGKSVNSLTDA